jgi:predicted alpha-1,2-mannosidase
MKIHLPRTVRRLLPPAAASLALLPAAAAPPADFASSFEAGDAPLRWTDTVEADGQGRKRAQGVVGPAPAGLVGNFLDKVAAVTANGENRPAGEVKENLCDGDIHSKWLVRDRTGWVNVALPVPRAAVLYALTSANDARERDPRDWTLQGSADGKSWTTLDSRSGESFARRWETRRYPLANRAAYQHYRLQITRNHGAEIVQLAELQLAESAAPPPVPPQMSTGIGKGPASAPAARTRVGFTGKQALRYAGTHQPGGRAHSTNRLYEVDLPVTASTELQYRIFPELSGDDLRYPSTYAAVDLAFSDGSYLSDHHAIDQHGVPMDARAQGASRTLFANQWNHKSAAIGAVAAGKTIRRILVAYDGPAGPAAFSGWIDDIRIGPVAPARPQRPSDQVLTTRGTHGSGAFSRGNNLPATALPAGFNFWTPVTNAGSLSWLYEYHRGNNADNRPALQAFAASHQPSPWMGDRQTFQVMPSTAADVPSAVRSARALAFGHDNEIARPHHYQVTFDNGLRTEIAPTDHAAIFRFTFPGDSAALVFDNVNNDGGLTLDPARRALTAHSDVRSGLSAGATRLYVYATFDRPVTASGMLPGGGGANVTGYFRFDAGRDRVVTMRIATSLISVEQARKNLALEIAPADTFETVRARAQKQWDDRLGFLSVQGATPDQLTTLYSNLYRLYLYPNSAHENTGSAARPIWRHAVQSATTTPPSGPSRTGAPIAAGKVYVNNGFWDTYRTTWAAYALFSPRLAGELIDGFVQQYRDGGWIARWSSPGYANLMTGTSSDVAFADAYLKGVTGFDAADAYAAALKNATVTPPGPNPDNTAVGRKGLHTSLFLGYTPSSVSEGVSWALEGYINDFGIANMARRLAERPGLAAAERRRYREEAAYLLARSQSYVNLYDPAVGFFQGRNAAGAWKSPPGAYDPRVWGHQHDYTETNGWNFAFHVPHDGQGLANLYGGRAGLARKLDAFFSTPETAGFPGSYGGIIHEMVEARDVRMGQWGFSNQVSHHIPWMYGYAGQPHKTQEKVREVLARLYVGSEIGQGYAGDEDNGETSAWYLFAALGLYPLQVGSPTYAIGSPLFTEAVVRLENGKQLVVRAPRNSPRNIYVQGLTIDGQPWDRSYLPHDRVANGAVLEFDLGPQPSPWATGPQSAPPSITTGQAAPRPLRDLSRRGKPSASAGIEVAPLFDDTSLDSAALTGRSPWVRVQLASPAQATFYTLTSADEPGDPSAWILEGSSDGGTTWTVIDRRQRERFPWRRQTRPFQIEHPGSYADYRLQVTAATAPGGARLAEIELLAPLP